MARKNKGAHTDAPGAADEPQANGRAARKKAPEPSTSALIICRNKHWRYISSFHGPWLQLPPEVLESLAHANYLSPRPRPIDPAVFFDLLKIRRAVDEATNLAVRATSGLTSAALSSPLHGGGGGGGGMLGQAAALGMGFGGGGGTLSRERKHRMRELATGKLAAAYRLDEIAASVATMQSASTLEDVAALVLQRAPADADAKYVHFFHEKIPSRMMAECTPLDALDDIVAERPADASALRTRALTRIFKDDYAASARDLTDALAAARYLAAAHRQGRDQLVLASPAPDPPRDWRSEPRVPDDDQPSSLEAQLLFHRAGVYFAIACGHVHAALDGLQAQEEAHATRDAQLAAGEEPIPETANEAAARLFRAESRKQVRQNAKRALRDYTAFLAHFDYTPGIAADVADEFLRRYHTQTNGHASATDYQSKLDRLLAESSTTSDALTPYKKPQADRATWPKLPPPPVFTLNQLFDPLPPASLPPFPAPAHTLPSPYPTNESLTYHPLLPEALHSLLLVHALLQTPPKELLRHAHNAARLVRLLDGYPVFLAARSPARSDWVEVVRRGGNWISLAGSWEKMCRAPSPDAHGGNGYAQGQAHGGQGGGSAVAKTGRRGAGGNAGGSGSGAVAGAGTNEETKHQRRERQKHEAILEALADERVVDEASFQRAVRAREQRFREDEKAEAEAEAQGALDASSPPLQTPLAIENGSPDTPVPAATETATESPNPATDVEKEKERPKRWAKPPSNPKDYPIGTERAEAIARWVRDAPPLTGENNTGKRKGRRRKGAGGKKKGSGLEVRKGDGEGFEGLERDVAALDVGEEAE